MQYQSSVNRKTALFRVTFRFSDDNANENRTTFIDASDSLDARRQLHRIYDDVGKIVKVEKVSR
jgi:hypothetical protein